MVAVVILQVSIQTIEALIKEFSIKNVRLPNFGKHSGCLSGVGDLYNNLLPPLAHWEQELWG